MKKNKELSKVVDDIKQDFNFIESKYNTLQEKIEKVKEIKQDIGKMIDVKASNIDIDKLSDFVNDKYWIINEKGKNDYEVILPQFMDVQVGVLDRQIGGYNIFKLDQTTKMISGIPDFIKDEVELTDGQNFEVKGDIVEFDKNKKEVIEKELDHHVEEVHQDKATIKKDHGYQLIRDLLDKGELPFSSKPVKDEHYRTPDTNIDLRSYQDRAYDQWIEKGSLCVCYMTGAGKSFVALEALDSIKYDEKNMRKAVIVFGKATEEQWKNYIKEFAPRLEDEVEVYTYQSLHKVMEKVENGAKYGIIVYDEAHALPADTFATGATIPTEYRMGLTASPYREDGRQNDIFALTGEPIGLNWNETLELMGKEHHDINIHTVESVESKIERVKKLLDKETTTLIFVDSIDIGNRLSEETGLTFVNGETNKQLDTLEEAIDEDNACIISRVGDHGISIDSLEHVIEVDFLFGSRRQEIQRTGRLFHGEGKKHDILFTFGEFNKYQKRLYSLIEKGFELNDVDGNLDIENIPDKYETKVSMNVGGEKVHKEITSTETQLNSPIEFLKNNVIKEIIKERIKDYDRVSDEKLWDTLLTIASRQEKEEKGVTHKELENIVGHSKGSMLTMPFRNKEPAIISKTETGYKLDVDRLSEIKSEKDQLRKTKEQLSELRKEVLN